MLPGPRLVVSKLKEHGITCDNILVQLAKWTVSLVITDGQFNLPKSLCAVTPQTPYHPQRINLNLTEDQSDITQSSNNLQWIWTCLF